VNLCIEIAEGHEVPLTVASEPQVHSFLMYMGFRDKNIVEWDLREWADDDDCGFGEFKVWALAVEG
jgi:hypothetical protein